MTAARRLAFLFAARAPLRTTLLRASLSTRAEPVANLILLSSLSGLTSASGAFAAVARDMVAPRDGPVCYVPTAKYAPNKLSTRKPGDQRRRARADARKKAKELETLFGRDVNLLELDAPGAAPGAVADALAGASCAYLDGGNTFYLRAALRRAGFDAALDAALDAAPGLVVVGQSAGAICAGDSIRTAYWKGWDDPGAADGVDWDAPAALDGLALAPGLSVFPHYAPDEHAALVAARSAELRPSRCVTLADDEAYVVRGGAAAMFSVAGGLVTVDVEE